MTGCPACDRYTHAERHAIDRAGHAHHRELDAIRRRERGQEGGYRFRPWERVDAATWTAS